MSERHRTGDSHVEVVADQTEDGAYELRVERQSDSQRVVASDSTETVRVSAPPAPGHGRMIGAVGGVLALAVIGGIVWAAVRDVDAAPPVAEPVPIETFRAFTIEPPVPTVSRSVLSIDVGVDATEPDTGSAASLGPVEGSGEPAQGMELVGAEVTDPTENAVPQIEPSTARRLESVRVSRTALVIPTDGDSAGDDEDEFAEEEYVDDEEFVDDEYLEDEEYLDDDEYFEEDEYLDE